MPQGNIVHATFAYPPHPYMSAAVLWALLCTEPGGLLNCFPVYLPVDIYLYLLVNGFWVG